MNSNQKQVIEQLCELVTYMGDNNCIDNCDCRAEGIYFDIFKQRVSCDEYLSKSREEYGARYHTDKCEHCGGVVYLAIF